MKKFKTIPAKLHRNEKLSGSSGVNNFSVRELSMNIFSHEPDGEKVLAYMIRRFGFPNHYYDDSKEICQWILTTPMKGVYLSVYPMGGSEFGYLCAPEIKKKITNEYFMPAIKYSQRVKKWTRKVHGINLFTTSFFSHYAIPTDSRKGLIYYQEKPFKVAVKEFNQWAKKNVKNMTDDEEKTMFEKEFTAFKNSQIKKYVALYEKIEKKPTGETPSVFIKKILDALSATAQDLLRYTSIRDTDFNILGESTEMGIKQAEKLFGENDCRIEYVNLNPSIAILKKYSK